MHISAPLMRRSTVPWLRCVCIHRDVILGW